MANLSFSICCRLLWLQLSPPRNAVTKSNNVPLPLAPFPRDDVLECERDYDAYYGKEQKLHDDNSSDRIIIQTLYKPNSHPI